MTAYTRKSFSVGAVGTEEYRKRWEQTFRGEPELCGRSCMASYAPPGYGSCGLPKGHEGECMTGGQIEAAKPMPKMFP